MSLVTWNDVYQELWIQAAQSRGTVTSVGELASVSHFSTLSEWPRTTGADVIAIASFVDPIVGATPLRPGGYGITRLWQTAVIEIESIAFSRPGAEYARNRALWSTLLAVAAYLSTMGAPVPDEDAWEALMAALWSPSFEYRNAAGPGIRTLTVSTFENMWTTLRDELAALRGFDVRDDELGSIEVPRTTNADVTQLAAYWSRALVQLQVKVMTGAVASPDDFEELQLQWQAATANVDNDARRGKPEAVYPGNVEIWRATHSLSVALGVLADPPPPYTIVDGGTPAPTTPGQRPGPRPTTPSQLPTSMPSSPKAADLSSRIHDAADTVARAINALAHEARVGLVNTFGRPLLIGGAAALGLILLLRATGNGRDDCERMLEAEAA